MNSSSKIAAAKPLMLVVDRELAVINMIRDVVTKAARFEIVSVGCLAEAKTILASRKVDILITDIDLPDGDGLDLVAEMQSKHPTSAAIVTAKCLNIERAVRALRVGAMDILEKPFSPELLGASLARALKKYSAAACLRSRLEYLRNTVRELQKTRQEVSKRVDLLCSDLVASYSQLVEEVNKIRLGDDLRKDLRDAKNVERLVCNMCDWLLRKIGYANMAMWLRDEEGSFQLGAYMKYSIPGVPHFTDAMRKGIVVTTCRWGLLSLAAEEVGQALSKDELVYLAHQHILSFSGTYLGETLAVITVFRDRATPFTSDHVEIAKMAGSIFAVALANICNGDEYDDSESGDDSQASGGSADWWKHGKEPPY